VVLDLKDAPRTAVTSYGLATFLVEPTDFFRQKLHSKAEIWKDFSCLSEKGLEKNEQSFPRPLQLLFGVFTGRLEMAPTFSLGRLKDVLPLLEEYALPFSPILQIVLRFEGILSALDIALQ